MNTQNDNTPWPNFRWSELACQCGRCDSRSSQRIDPRLMDNIQTLRDHCGSLFISSAYRCPEHPAEKDKKTPGTHAKGMAVDIRCTGAQAWSILKVAAAMGCFTGIGISQKGDHGRRFIHLDISTTGNRPWLWSY